MYKMNVLQQYEMNTPLLCKASKKWNHDLWTLAGVASDTSFSQRCIICQVAHAQLKNEWHSANSDRDLLFGALPALQNCSGTAATMQLGELERLSKLAFKSHLTRTVQNEIEQAERLLGEVEGEPHGGEGKIWSVGFA